MRVAISLTGFMRTWEYTKRSFIDKLLGDSSVKVDVFVHTYHQNYYEMTAGKQDVFMDRASIEELLKDIPVRSLVIEDRDCILDSISVEANKYSHTENFGLAQLESSDKNSISVPIGVRTYDHLRKLSESNDYINKYAEDNSFTYDLVVKTRFDVVYFNVPRWSTFVDGSFHFGYGATWGWPEDTFCVAQPPLMNKYLGRFREFSEMFDKADPKVKGICSHGTLKYIINKYNISIGLPAVNILCFRSETIVQYGGNYRYRCDINWIYDRMSRLQIDDVHELEGKKFLFMRF